MLLQNEKETPNLASLQNSSAAVTTARTRDNTLKFVTLTMTYGRRGLRDNFLLKTGEVCISLPINRKLILERILHRF